MVASPKSDPGCKSAWADGQAAAGTESEVCLLLHRAPRDLQRLVGNFKGKFSSSVCSSPFVMFFMALILLVVLYLLLSSSRTPCDLADHFNR